MFTILPSLEEKVVDLFLHLFESEQIQSIELDLYNGTGTGYTELPNGGHIEHRRFSLVVKAVEHLQPALESVDYNQVQKCCVSFQEGGSYRSVTLDLLERKVVGAFPLHKIETLLRFCQENEITSCFLRF